MYIIRTEAFRNGIEGYEVVNAETLKRFCVVKDMFSAKGICEALNNKNWDTDCNMMCSLINEWAHSAHRVDLKLVIEFLISKVEH